MRDSNANSSPVESAASPVSAFSHNLGRLLPHRASRCSRIPNPIALFLALCRRYGLKPYRLYRQRLTTVMLRVPTVFVDQVLWPEFQELNKALTQYLNDVTTRVVRDEVHRDTSEAAEITQALPAQ